jgi:hypothetical protein
MAFKNTVLRKTLRPNGHEVRADWKKLQNQELHNPYSQTNTIHTIKQLRLKRAEHVARTGERRDTYRVLVGKP